MSTGPSIIVGLFILQHPGKTFGSENNGLYRDGVWQTKRKTKNFRTTWIKNYTGGKFTRSKSWMLPSTLHLENTDLIGSPMTIRYTCTSNHPPGILRQLPISIDKHISTLSSDKQTFQHPPPTYQTVLGHTATLHITLNACHM